MVSDKTMKYNAQEPNKESNKEILKEVYAALVEKGYNPISQIVGYILSGDPTYITNHKDARALISKIEKDELLQQMITTYLGLE